MSRFSLPKTEMPLSEESAYAQVMELVGYYSLDIDAVPDKDTKAVVEACAEKLVQFYRMGLLENVRDAGELRVKQNLKNPPGEVASITYGVMRGDAKLATDGYDPNERYARSFAMMEKLSGSISGTVKKLQGIDLAVVENLGVFFLLGSS